MRLILLDGFSFVHIPFDIMVKFQFLVQFPEDHLSYTVISWLILLYASFIIIIIITIITIIIIIIITIIIIIITGLSLEFKRQQIS